jgi:ribonuclease G
VGYEKDAFLHYLDLGSQVNSLNKYTKLAIAGKPACFPWKVSFSKKRSRKPGRSPACSPNQPVLVQIAKEPISTKGPRITSEISLAGRYLVLVPFSDRISVSQKIQSNEEKPPEKAGAEHQTQEFRCNYQDQFRRQNGGRPGC